MAACLAALFQIALVVFLRAPEGLCRFDLGHNTLRFKDAFRGELFDFCQGLGLLLRRANGRR